MTLAEVIDEHFLSRYRALLDAEDTAFDELEHCYEDGDRAHWEADLRAWRAAVLPSRERILKREDLPSGLSANRKLSGFHGGISPVKSAYRKLTHHQKTALVARKMKPRRMSE